MSEGLVVDFDCVGTEWEVEEFMAAVGHNLEAKSHWSDLRSTKPREPEWHGVRVYYDVPHVFAFLRAALSEDAFTDAMLKGLDAEVKDLSVVINNVEVD